MPPRQSQRQPDLNDKPSVPRMKPINTCPDCGEFSLSEVLVCKGTRKKENRGRHYQKVWTNFVVHNNHSPSICAEQRLRNFTFSYNTHSQKCAEYHNCSGFRWRDDMPSVMGQVDDFGHSASLLEVNPEYSVTNGVGKSSDAPELNDRGTIIMNACPGMQCAQRTRSHIGNKSCSNGGLCKTCCEKAQQTGSSRCSYSSHNRSIFSLELDNPGNICCSDIYTANVTLTEAMQFAYGSSENKQTSRNTAGRSDLTTGALSGIRSDNNVKTFKGTILPYHVSNVLFATASPTPVRITSCKEAWFQLVWHREVICSESFIQ